MPETVVDGDGRTVWSILGEPRRHHVLRYLAETAEPTTTTAVSRSIVDYCDGDRERVQMELKHVDVPKLADAGVVDYDPDRDRIEPTPHVDRLCEALDAVETTLQQ